HFCFQDFFVSEETRVFLAFGESNRDNQLMIRLCSRSEISEESMKIASIIQFRQNAHLERQGIFVQSVKRRVDIEACDIIGLLQGSDNRFDNVTFTFLVIWLALDNI